MTTSPMGRKVLAAFEGLRLKVYADAVGLPTVGIGHLVMPEDNLNIGDVISYEQADDFLRKDLITAENAVNHQVIVLLNQHQFDALVSLVFNIGTGNFSTSTVRKRLNSGDFEGAADAFLMWNKAGGKVLEGLAMRRKAERLLFLGDEG